MNEEWWRMMISSCWGVLITDRQTELGTFVTENSSKLMKIDENLMKSKLFVTKIILVTFGDINVNKESFLRSQWDVLNVELITFETKCIDFMRFLSISINLLELFRIMSFVFDLNYLSQNSINLNILGVFWNPQDEQFSKLSLDLHFEQDLKEILRVLHW